MKRTLFILVVAAAVLGAGATAAHAAGSFLLGPRLSLELDEGNDVAVGLEARFEIARIAPTVGLQLRPNIDFYFIENLRLIDLAFDVLFTFDLRNGTVEPYAGAGLSVFLYDFDGPGGSGSEGGLNLIAGIKFLPRGAVQPFIELRPTIGDIDPTLLTFGVLFVL